MKPTVYLETSFFGYLTSRMSTNMLVAARQHVTRHWWASERSSFDLFVSPFVIEEAASGDAEAASDRIRALDELPILTPDDLTLHLASALVDAVPLPPKAAVDAAHIAIAARHAMDYVLTWNFKHIANATLRDRIGQVCRLAGYEPPVLCSPEELTLRHGTP